jgi:hypothetical protein
MTKPRKQEAHLHAFTQTSGYLPMSPRMNLKDWVIEVEKYQARSDEDKWLRVDLGGLWLPTSSINTRPVRLTSQTDLCVAICTVVDQFLVRQTWSKSTHVIAITKIAELAKFFEYCWLKGIFRLRDWTAEMWGEFLNTYRKGGWSSALDLRRRAEATILETGVESIAKDFVSRGSLPLTFLAKMGTNAKGKDITAIRQVIQRALNLPLDGDPVATRLGVSFSSLARISTGLSCLADVPAPLGMTSVPTENPYLYAQRHGRAQCRTPNVDPESLALVLQKAYEWIHEVGPLIVLLYEELAPAMPTTSSSKTQLNRDRNRKLEGSQTARLIEQRLGTKLSRIRSNAFGPGGTSPATLLKMTATACFMLIAVFNGRRKDEVAGRRIGLYDGALQTEEQDLGLLSCNFYIEKTDKDYLPFYVNEITGEAINLMIRLSRVAWSSSSHQTSLSERERKLFILPSLTQDAALWFKYEEKHTRPFLKWAAADSEAGFNINAHSFRRAYAVVFQFRYENATLVSLSQQLRHRDLGMALHYVTESSSRPMNERAEKMWAIPHAARKAQIAHAERLREEIETVASEKLHLVISGILEGSERSSGGFAKLVTRFNQKLGKHIEYDRDSLSGKKSKLTELMLHRGHRPIAFAHGDCNAGPVKRGAGCFSQVSDSLDRTKASPHVCRSCPYHRCTEVHLQAMKNQAVLDEIEVTRAAGTLHGRKMALELENLKRAIELHEQRLRA